MSEIITCPSGISGRIRGIKVREARVFADRRICVEVSSAFPGYVCCGVRSGLPSLGAAVLATPVGGPGTAAGLSTIRGVRVSSRWLKTRESRCETGRQAQLSPYFRTSGFTSARTISNRVSRDVVALDNPFLCGKPLHESSTTGELRIGDWRGVLGGLGI